MVDRIQKSSATTARSLTWSRRRMFAMLAAGKKIIIGQDQNTQEKRATLPDESQQPDRRLGMR